MKLQPLSIFLVKNGQGGDRVLFRYPYKVSTPKKQSTSNGLESDLAKEEKTRPSPETAAGAMASASTSQMGASGGAASTGNCE